jgi:broad specificity phosphatase PhoE
VAKIYIMQTGKTTWEDESRVVSAAGSPLSEQGSRTVQAAAMQLPVKEIAAVYAGRGEAEYQTAMLVAKKLKLRVRTHKDLHELDYGLWQGLTFREIKRRQPRVYKQWTERPGSIRPPGGETLEEARQRLRKAVRDIVKRQKGSPVLLVLSPVATGLVRCMLQGEVIGSFWRHVDRGFEWCSYEIADGGESL